MVIYIYSVSPFDKSSEARESDNIKIHPNVIFFTENEFWGLHVSLFLFGWLKVSK